MKILTYMRRGCWGDTVFALTAISAYKRKHPDHQIYFSTKVEEFIPLALYNPDITQIVPWNDIYFCSRKQLNYDRIYNVGDDVCCVYEARHHPPKKSRIEILCRQLDYCYPYVNPKVYLTPAEMEVVDFYKRTLSDKFVIGVVSRTHSPVRSYDNFDDIDELLPEDVHVLVFKKYNIDWSDTQWDIRHTEIFIDRPIREVLVLLSVCNVVIGCDTGPMHSAAVLGIPTIWLFGATDGKLATKEYENVTVIQKKELCKHIPCWYNLQCEKNCADLQSICLKGIKPEEIINEIFPIYEKWKESQ
jgi:hypothetical protein